MTNGQAGQRVSDDRAKQFIANLRGIGAQHGNMTDTYEGRLYRTCADLLDSRVAEARLRQELTAKDAEIERLQRQNQALFRDLQIGGEERRKAEAALRAARTVDDEMVERAKEALLGLPGSSLGGPRGIRFGPAMADNLARTALTAALSPGQVGEETNWFEGTEDCNGNSTPPPSHDQAGGGDLCKRDGKPCYVGKGTEDAHFRCGTSACGGDESDAAVSRSAAIEHEDRHEKLGVFSIRWTRGPDYERAYLCVEDGEPDMNDFAEVPWGQAEKFKAGLQATEILARRAPQPNAAVAAVVELDAAIRALSAALEWPEQFSTKSALKRAVEALRTLPSAPEPTASDLVCRLDHVLHDMCNEGSDDDRWHAERAHGLVHEAARHLSPDAHVRELARVEREPAREPVAWRDIVTERRRQVHEEDWSTDHDDGHDEGELALAACCYAAPCRLYMRFDYASQVVFRDPWPWAQSWDKREYAKSNVFTPNGDVAPEKRRDLLVKSGALILAEIERLDRVAASSEPSR